MDKQELGAFLATVTPDRIDKLVMELEPQQAKANRGTVPLYEVLEALSHDLPAGQMAERPPIETHLRKAVIAAVEQIEGMIFIEGDS